MNSDEPLEDLLGVAEAFATEARWAEALFVARKALERSADSARAWSVQGRALAGLDKVPEAERSLDEALRRVPDDAAALSARAMLRLRHKDEPGALRDLEAMLKVLPPGPERDALLEKIPSLRAPDARRLEVLKRAEALADAKDWTAACALCDEALASDPESAAAWNLKGYCLRALERREEALAAFKRARLHLPIHAPIRYNLGLALLEAGDRRGALAEFEETLRLDPSDLQAREVLAKVRRELDESD